MEHDNYGLACLRITIPLPFGNPPCVDPLTGDEVDELLWKLGQYDAQAERHNDKGEYRVRRMGRERLAAQSWEGRRP